MNEEQRQRFSAIAHRGMAIMNPLSEAVLDEAIEQLQLPAEARVLDLGCGKATCLIKVIERYDAHGIGVELSPFALAEARAAGMRHAGGTLELVEGDARRFPASASFDLVIALGPGWPHDNFPALLAELRSHVKPAGQLLAADGYWLRQPGDGYLKLLGASRDELASHEANLRSGLEAGLAPMWSATASVHDWDRYEWGYLANVERWVAAHPDDPDTADFLARAHLGRDRYLGGGREQLGFGIYLFRVPA